MKKLLTVFVVAVSLLAFTGCQEAENLQKDAADSYGKLSDGVIDAKENVEGTVQNVKDTADNVKETIDNASNTLNEVKKASDSVTNLLDNEET